MPDICLFAVETAIVKGGWFYLPLAIACCGILTPVHLYFVALLLAIYVPTRLFLQGRQDFRSSTKLCLKLAAFPMIGVGLATFFWLNTLSVIENSPRGSGLTSYASKLRAFPVFGFETVAHYSTAILRQFSNDMAGTGSHFLGWQNYLEAPSSCCGLICLLLIPQAFVAASARWRLIYALFLLAVGLLTLFPWFRYLFWLFQGDYYRTFSLFVVFGMVSLGVGVGARAISSAERLAYGCSGLTLLALIVILYLPITELQGIVSFRLRQASTYLLWAYAAVLTAGKWLRRESLASWILADHFRI